MRHETPWEQAAAGLGPVRTISLMCWLPGRKGLQSASCVEP